MEEAFFFAKLIMPEGSPPEALSGRAKIILALKVARHVDTGLPLSEPLWEEPAPEPPRQEKPRWEDLLPGLANELCGRFWDDV